MRRTRRFDDSTPKPWYICCLCNVATNIRTTWHSIFDIHFRKREIVRHHSKVYNVWVWHVSTVRTTRAHLLIKAGYNSSDTSKTATRAHSPTLLRAKLISVSPRLFNFICTCSHCIYTRKYNYTYICYIYPQNNTCVAYIRDHLWPCVLRTCRSIILTYVRTSSLPAKPFFKACWRPWRNNYS